MPSIRAAATGQSIRRRLDPTHGDIWYVRPGALVHLTDGTPNSRTGHNVKALCGATARPEIIEGAHGGRVCSKCAAALLAVRGSRSSA